MKYIAGLSTGNIIRRSASLAITSEDALFPRTNLYDGLPSKRYKAGTATPPLFLFTDQNLIVNPGFENAPLVNWTSGDTGTGVSSDTGVTVHSGAHALKCNGGAGGLAQRSQPVAVRCGERLSVSAWMRGPGATAALRVLDYGTAKYLKPDGTWTATPTDLFTSTAAAYTLQTFAFQVESYEVHQQPTTTLAIILYTTSNGDAFFDDLLLIPTVNFCGVFGHNIQPGAGTIVFQSSDDAFAHGTIEATMTPYQPAFYATISPANHQYWGFLVNNSNIINGLATAIWMGELVFGYAESAGKGQMYGYEDAFEDPQLRSAGGEYAFLQRNSEARGLTLPFQWTGDTQFLEALQDIEKRSRFGGDTSVIIPRDSGREVIMGRQMAALKVTNPDSFDVRRGQLIWDPLPYPSIVP